MSATTRRGVGYLLALRSRRLSSRRVGGAVVVLAAAIGLTTWATWPLVTCLDRCVVDSSTLGTGWIDAAFRRDIDLVTWILAWVAHALCTHPTALFDANIFHPAPDALATTEHLLGLQVLYLPLALASGDPVWSHQVTLLATFAAAFVTMFALVRAWTGSWAAAATAGMLYAFSPLRAQHLAMLPMEAAWLLPLVVLAAERTTSGGGTRWAVTLAAALAIQVLSSYYVGYASAVATAVLIAVVAFDAGSRRHLGALVGAVAVALGVVVACSLPYLRARAEGALPAPDPAHVAMTSASLGKTGAPLAVLIAVATAPWWRRGLAPGRRPVWLVGVALAGVCANLLALGPSIQLGSIVIPGPFAVAAELIPGWSFVRAPARLNVATTMSAGVLAGIGVAGLARRLAARSSALGHGTLAAALGVALVSVPLTMHRPIQTARVWKTGQEPPVSVWLARAADAPVLEVPLYDFYSRPYALGLEALRMRYSVRNWRPLLGGYSGYAPTTYPTVSALARALPDARALDLLVRMTGVRWIVLHRVELDRAARRRWAAARGLFRTAVVLAPDVVLEPRARGDADLMPALLHGTVDATPLGTPRVAVARDDRRAALVLDEPIRPIRWGVRDELSVQVANRGAATWPAMGVGERRLVTLACRWLDAAGRVVAEGRDAGRLPWDVAAGETVPAHVVIDPPATPGAAVLVVGVAQDGEWFDGTTAACFASDGGRRACAAAGAR